MNFKLYLIGDRKLFPNEDAYLDAVEKALRCGVKAFQLREKDMSDRELFYLAEKFRDLTEKYRALLFINDRIDIALAVSANGVHLPQNGFPADVVRKVWKSQFFIGVSTHSIEEATEACRWADFITFSPIYPTASKPGQAPQGLEKLKEIKGLVKCKVFALGGINKDNIAEVFPYCDGVAMIRGVLGGNIEKNVEKLKKFLGDLL